MRIIVDVTDPAVIEEILKHLGGSRRLQPSSAVTT
ncbi:MAG: hypothetical protein ACI9R8_000687 [Candidatus Paceibacteria bacterium]|jgi:hypothetical protein